MKTLIALIFLCSCGMPKQYRVAHLETKPGTLSHALVYTALDRRGFDFETVNIKHIKTEMMYVAWDKGMYNERWFGWYVDAKFKEDRIILESWCMETKARHLKKRWMWKPCQDKLVRDIVAGEVETLAVDIKRNR